MQACNITEVLLDSTLNMAAYRNNLYSCVYPDAYRHTACTPQILALVSKYAPGQLHVYNTC